MPDPKATAKAALLRGAVLALLYDMAEEPLNTDVLLSMLTNLHYDPTPRTLAQAIAYLKDRKCLTLQELTTPELPTLRIVRAQITAEGMDLVEGTTESVDIHLR